MLLAPVLQLATPAAALRSGSLVSRATASTTAPSSQRLVLWRATSTTSTSSSTSASASSLLSVRGASSLLSGGNAAPRSPLATPPVPRALVPSRTMVDVSSLLRSVDVAAVVEKSKTTIGSFQLFHYSSYALGLVTLGVFLSKFTLPADLLLNVAIPVHMKLGGEQIVQDYAKDKFKPLGDAINWGTAGITALALLKLNLFDVGTINAVGMLWSK